MYIFYNYNLITRRYYSIVSIALNWRNELIVSRTVVGKCYWRTNADTVPLISILLTILPLPIRIWKRRGAVQCACIYHRSTKGNRLDLGFIIALRLLHLRNFPGLGMHLSSMQVCRLHEAIDFQNHFVNITRSLSKLHAKCGT